MRKLVNIKDERFWKIFFDEACIEGTQNERIYKKLEALAELEKNPWIPCDQKMPGEYPTIFAKFKGTHQWHSSMFEKISNEVNVTVLFPDRTLRTCTSHTVDGVWKIEKDYPVAKPKVIAWKPLPEPYSPRE